MNCKIGDRVVHRDNVNIGGSVVAFGERYVKDLGDGYYQNVIEVLWDDECSIQQHIKENLFPESITMTPARQPELLQRVQRLEKLSTRWPTCGYDNNMIEEVKKLCKK